MIIKRKPEEFAHALQVFGERIKSVFYEPCEVGGSLTHVALVELWPVVKTIRTPIGDELPIAEMNGSFEKDRIKEELEGRNKKVRE